jgi:hypothetical protein
VKNPSTRIPTPSPVTIAPLSKDSCTLPDAMLKSAQIATGKRCPAIATWAIRAPTQTAPLYDWVPPCYRTAVRGTVKMPRFATSGQNPSAFFLGDVDASITPPGGTRGVDQTGTGHRPVQMVRRYTGNDSFFRENSAAKLGLCASMIR